ncbi:hypothetical protein GGI25_002947 [Coemansia spiralis]|uniref:Uncharacterized protein n=2 Tax=Coemansia TaxID=4863 RepID=A0A9W8G2X8_9FUNG|nr:hypothetical protein EDC05_002389 [Coemansia umbellata]KAJ2621315.1 hypothetical protein GGI26_004192 [Coemansia sp. RSA 1358]KAJ2677702.1 hypothetical protein GGI25_002947 [Coemansia spiralis]
MEIRTRKILGFRRKVQVYLLTLVIITFSCSLINNWQYVHNQQKLNAYSDTDSGSSSSGDGVGIGGSKSGWWSTLFASNRYTIDYSCAATRLDPTLWAHSYAHNSQPFAILPNDKPFNSKKGGSVLKVVAGQPVCVRIVVPPINSANAFDLEEKRITEMYQPIPGHPGLWDSIVLDAIGEATGISVSIALSPVQHIQMSDRNAVHIYEGEIQIFDDDSFSIRGIVEHREAQWNYDPPTTVPLTYSPEAILVQPGTQIKVDVPQSSIYHPKNYQKLPACLSADEPGRWVSAKSLSPPPQTMGLPINKGRVWMPYKCKLIGYTYSEFLQCLDSIRPYSPNRKGTYTIHWFGDTNTRRALKKITSLGSWCTESEAHKMQCSCDDSGEVFSRFTGQNSVRDTLLDLNDEDGGWSVLENGKKKVRTMFSPLARIYYHRWEGLTIYNGALGWRSVFSAENLSAYPRADLLVISLSTLDASFTPFLEYTRQISELIALIKANYGGRHIILRSPQYTCCYLPKGTPLRRVQRDRNRLYGEYTQRMFKYHFGPLLHMWDVSRLAEALPAESRIEAATCAVNNVPAGLVDVENHLLISSLCNADPLDSRNHGERDGKPAHSMHELP